MYFLLYLFFTYETWKEIEGYSGKYLISNRGRVKGKGRSKIIGTGIREGYYSVTLMKLRSKKQFHIHRIVAKHFVKKRNRLHKFVNHKDGDKLNNDYENLEWCTPLENSRHHFWNWKISEK